MRCQHAATAKGPLRVELFLARSEYTSAFTNFDILLVVLALWPQAKLPDPNTTSDGLDGL